MDFSFLKSEGFKLFLISFLILFFELVGVSLVVGILAGCYPAIFLSRLRPVQILRGGPLVGKKGAGAAWRRSGVAACEHSMVLADDVLPGSAVDEMGEKVRYLRRPRAHLADLHRAIDRVDIHLHPRRSGDEQYPEESPEGSLST